jgi:hypothetical protein
VAWGHPGQILTEGHIRALRKPRRGGHVIRWVGPGQNGSFLSSKKSLNYSADCEQYRSVDSIDPSDKMGGWLMADVGLFLVVMTD